MGADAVSVDTHPVLSWPTDLLAGRRGYGHGDGAG
ncbi:MAG: hypothetical protein QOG69_981, partial [Actinomycetota bacterium]|nr:hypothetical protein [Actinomycetota bacterium]